jgi:monoamine oxidase
MSISRFTSPYWRAIALGLLSMVIAWMPPVPVARAEVVPASQSLEVHEPIIETPVLVVGAGLAGLTAAHRMREAGLEVTVLEATTHLGGRMRSARYPEGVSAEAGLEELWDSNPAVALAGELGVRMEPSATAFSSFMHAGKLYPMNQESNEAFVRSVLGPKEFVRFQAWDRRMQALHARVWQRPLPADLKALQNVSFGEWLAGKSGLSPLAQALVRAETEPEFGQSADAISALDGIDEWHIFSGKGTGSHHVVGGNQRLAEVLADRIGRDRIHLGSQVTRIARFKDHVDVTALDTSTYTVRHFRARHVVTTMPLFRLYEIQMDPPLSPRVQQAIATQTWGSYFVAHVVLDRRAERFWHRNGEDLLPILSGGPLGVIYGGNPPEAPTGATILNLLVTGPYAEAYNARTGSVDDVRKAIAPELEKLWPGIGRDVRYMTFVRYHPRAIAGWPVGRSRFDEPSDEVRRPQGRLYLAGDFTENTHSDGSSWSAIRVVRQICAAEGVPVPAGLPERHPVRHIELFKPSTSSVVTVGRAM